MFSKIWGALKWLGRLFKSQAAQTAMELVDQFVPHVSPIVEEIRKIIPSVKDATFEDIKRAYQAFSVSVDNIMNDKKLFGFALATLALEVVRRRLGDTTTPERIIRAAIEIVLVMIKAR